jgi:hypothetical protein
MKVSTLSPDSHPKLASNINYDFPSFNIFKFEVPSADKQNAYFFVKLEQYENLYLVGLRFSSSASLHFEDV